ncbi:hypothetical protein C0Q70_03100 [Pomacea canaliculata]|uniref:Uncharacterized protein n=1 Tax=Pomacea canaliculata TaxID=400727 RepID=A0A2T7PRX4_POMCA|nr:hypothetical protein C0Q70_03100 [Pomacea canaliculata]
MQRLQRMRRKFCQQEKITLQSVAPLAGREQKTLFPDVAVGISPLWVIIKRITRPRERGNSTMEKK